MADIADARVMHDLIFIQKAAHQGIVLDDISNLRNFNAFLAGPSDTPYETGMFVVKVKIPKDYPISPPDIYFKTPVFHPNVLEDGGSVCVDLLDDKWVAGMTILTALDAVLRLLEEPNPDSPMNVDASSMMRRDEEMYKNTAKMYTYYFAGGVNKVPEMEEKIDIVSAFMSRKKALVALAHNRWDADRAIP